MNYLLWYSSLALFTSTSSPTRGLYSGENLSLMSVLMVVEEYPLVTELNETGGAVHEDTAPRKETLIQRNRQFTLIVANSDLM